MQQPREDLSTMTSQRATPPAQQPVPTRGPGGRGQLFLVGVVAIALAVCVVTVMALRG